MTEELEEQEDPGGSLQGLETGVTVIDEQHLPVDVEQVRAIATRTLVALGVPAEVSLTITLADETRIADLKREALGIHAATDVLTFPLDDPTNPAPGPVVLGDIVVCPAVADKQARALGRTRDEEIPHLIVHGLLHMMGRTHDAPDDERAMAAEERELLGRIR